MGEGSDIHVGALPPPPAPSLRWEAALGKGQGQSGFRGLQDVKPQAPSPSRAPKPLVLLKTQPEICPILNLYLLPGPGYRGADRGQIAPSSPRAAGAPGHVWHKAPPHLPRQGLGPRGLPSPRWLRQLSGPGSRRPGRGLTWPRLAEKRKSREEAASSSPSPSLESGRART